MKSLTFKQILTVAVFAGLFAGLILSMVQTIQVVPTILEAETYEAAGAVAPQHEHEATQLAAHEHPVWAPEDGLERTVYTTFSNVTIGLGFGLLLGAVVAFRGRKINIAQGVLWGAAGYAVFYIAPSLGLPAEIPGMQAAPLGERQLWWLFAVSGAAVGLALIVFGKQIVLKIVGVALIVAPHVLGAPMPEVHGGLAPDALVSQFITATAIANGVFWLALGAATGFLYHKLLK